MCKLVQMAPIKIRNIAKIISWHIAKQVTQHFSGAPGCFGPSCDRFFQYFQNPKSFCCRKFPSDSNGFKPLPGHPTTVRASAEPKKCRIHRRLRKLSVYEAKKKLRRQLLNPEQLGQPFKFCRLPSHMKRNFSSSSPEFATPHGQPQQWHLCFRDGRPM